MLESTKRGGVFLSVKADGKFHQTVPVGTAGAILREGVLKDGTTFSKTELLFDAVSGKINVVSIYAGKFGQSVNLSMSDGEDDFIVSFDTSGNFGEDVLKKILSVDTSKSVRLVPYVFTPEGKSRESRGVTIYQDDTKVKNFFALTDPVSKKVTNMEGFPEFPVAVKGKKPDTDDYKIYNMKSRKFMVEKIEERFSNKQAVSGEETPMVDGENSFGFEDEDVPF